MKNEEQIYVYCGPVMLFDKCIADEWRGQTTATSSKRAKSNLTYQFKLQYGYGVRTKIKLPGKVGVVEKR